MTLGKSARQLLDAEQIRKVTLILMESISLGARAARPKHCESNVINVTKKGVSSGFGRAARAPIRGALKNLSIRPAKAEENQSAPLPWGV